MSYSLNKGYTDTITTPKNVAIPDLDYANDFHVSRDVPGEVVMTNTTSPLDREESIRFSITNVKDIYTGTSVDPAYFAPSHQGISLVIQVNDTWRYEDAVDPTAQAIDLPITSHIVIKAPKTSYIDADNYLSIVKRAVSLAFDTGSVTSNRLMMLLKGALNPNN